MNNDPRRGNAIIAVREERARIGGVEAVRQTYVAATNEGAVAVQVDTVQPTGGYTYRPALAPPPPRYQPNPAITYREEPSCTDYCCLACDSEYEWYKLEGKGCCWIPVLLLFYLIAGIILLPFLILYLVCLCVCYPLGCCKNNGDSDFDRPLFSS